MWRAHYPLTIGAPRRQLVVAATLRRGRYQLFNGGPKCYCRERDRATGGGAVRAGGLLAILDGGTPGFAVTLTAIFTRPTLAQCDWQLLAMGVAVMILATISDEIASRGASAARRGVLFSPQRDGPREWIWSALGITPRRVLVVGLAERQLTIAGQPAWVYLFVATSSFSRRLYVKTYRYEHQTTWLDGLENALF